MSIVETGEKVVVVGGQNGSSTKETGVLFSILQWFRTRIIIFFLCPGPIPKMEQVKIKQEPNCSLGSEQGSQQVHLLPKSLVILLKHNFH